MSVTKFSCLVVEDNPEDQQYFLDAIDLVCDGCSCYAVNDGEQAIITLLDRDFQPDYIFTDLHMPNMDGFELLSVVKGIDYLKHIPVIIFSDDFSDQQLEKAKSLGASALYSKTRSGMLPHILRKYLKPLSDPSTVL
jgi:CheY-like chemotaxis protein